MKAKWLVAAALFTLTACASAPKIDYYTLDMAASGNVRSDADIVVERLQTTEALSRSQILIQSSPTRVVYYATDRWAGSIGELAQQKLTAEFGEPGAGSKNLVLSGTVVAFEQVDGPGGASAKVELRARVRDAASKRFEEPMLEKAYVASRPLGTAGPDQVAAGLSRCLEQIAAEIVADLNTR